MVVAGASIYLYWWFPKEETKDLQEPIVCAEETKACPGGYPLVVRTGPNCEFAPCPKLDTFLWPTYTNKEIGIEFKYDSGYNYIIEKLPSIAGEIIIVYFYPPYNNFLNSDFSFIALSSDYWDLGDIYNFIRKDISCPDELDYDKKGNVCRIIKVGEIDGIFENNFDWISSPYSGVLFKNKTNSVYKHLMFSLNLDIIYKLDEDERLANYTELYPQELDRLYAEALSYSKNVMERKNLSARDEAILYIMDEILSSVKFIR